MECNSCRKKLKIILNVNTKIYTCENNKCHKYGILICNPYSEVDECIKEIFNGEKNEI